jgi:protein transport protein SEC24
MLNEVPLEYFCHVDGEGRRRDLDERPELNSGTVEYVAPAEYMVRPSPSEMLIAVELASILHCSSLLELLISQRVSDRHVVRGSPNLENLGVGSAGPSA